MKDSPPPDGQPAFFQPPGHPPDAARQPGLDLAQGLERRRKWQAVALLAVCQVFALALWFSATAVIPVFKQDYALTNLQGSLITSSVSVGFVVGTLVSAFLGLADRVRPRLFFMSACFTAAAANLAILAVPPTSPLVPVLRLIVGLCMAGIYPVGLKIAASWAQRDMGLLVGLLVGALTLGSASPHLINAFPLFDWRVTIAVASALAVAAGLMVNLVQLGPNIRRAVKFEPRFALQAWTKKSLRLANFGYFGHMWELYAMWGWAGLFLRDSFAISPGGNSAELYAKLLTFATIAVGGFGCLFGGLFADRIGRTALTMGAMAISGSCAILAGLAFGGNPWLVVVLFTIWGVTVVADSAQFSASIMELADPWLVGTMVTIQTSVGFFLSIVTIHMIPPLVDLVGWRFAFASLAIGPFLGIWAMGVLRGMPEARSLASGNR